MTYTGAIDLSQTPSLQIEKNRPEKSNKPENANIFAGLRSAGME